MQYVPSNKEIGLGDISLIENCRLNIILPVDVTYCFPQILKLKAFQTIKTKAKKKYYKYIFLRLSTLNALMNYKM